MTKMARWCMGGVSLACLVHHLLGRQNLRVYARVKDTPVKYFRHLYRADVLSTYVLYET